jgi:hypothetical protein
MVCPNEAKRNKEQQDSLTIKTSYMELVLLREYHPSGVNGAIWCGDKKICNTIERPWKDNARQVSCIPEGRYELGRRYTERWGWHCRVLEVPGRDGILIHAFNFALTESRGCIGPVSFHTSPGEGSFSRFALMDLMDFLDDSFDQSQPVFLTIKNKEDEIDTTESERADAEVL